MNPQSKEEKTMLDVVKEVLDEMELNYGVDEERQLIQLSMADKTGANRYVIDVDDATTKLVVYMICSVRVPENRRGDAAEYLTRANYGLTIGNFEMDFRDGEVRFKCSARLPGCQLSSEIVKLMFGVAVAMTDRYLEGLLQVLFGNRRPAEVIQECEAGLQADDQANAAESNNAREEVAEQ